MTDLVTLRRVIELLKDIEALPHEESKAVLRKHALAVLGAEPGTVSIQPLQPEVKARIATKSRPKQASIGERKDTTVARVLDALRQFGDAGLLGTEVDDLLALSPRGSGSKFLSRLWYEGACRRVQVVDQDANNATRTLYRYYHRDSARGEVFRP